MLEESQFISFEHNHLLFPNSPFQIPKPQDISDYEIPFDPQPLQMMFEYAQSEQVSPKQIAKKPSNFLNPQYITPQKQYSQRRYQSERIERRTYNMEYQQIPQRKEKGLRHLSQKVRDIVMELKSTSYKDVAERLIQDLCKEDNRFIEQDNSKDEQNIKRRVYDALNVMIASKVLKKDGKKVKSDLITELQSINKQQDRDYLKNILTLSKKSINKKKQRLSEQLRKWKASNALLERNIQMDQSNISIFKFPVMLFFSDQQHSKFTKEKKNGVKIFSYKPIQLVSDFEIAKTIFNFPVNIENVVQECDSLRIRKQ